MLSARTPSVGEQMFDVHPHPFLGELNAEQRAAATHSGETLLILAGAGTGKTTTLCARVAWLMAEGVRPNGSCCSRSPAARPGR